mgnify:CR=1 FL=1
MSTLLLRLAAPLQSWGVASKFDTRDTAREPTKSGVIGLIAAALGCSRTDSGDAAKWLEKLKDLNFAVRVDQTGVLLRDYHTAKKLKDQTSFVTVRYYLADAIFLVGLEGEKSFLMKLMEALQNPVFPLYLGRRSCPPTGRMVLGIRERTLQQALEEESWQASEWYQKRKSYQAKLTIVRDAKSSEQDVFLRRDLPISFDQRNRRYGFRYVSDIAEALYVSIPERVAEEPTECDAMEELED